MNSVFLDIPAKNIDFGKNDIKVEKNIFAGNKTTLRVDKLSFTSEPESRKKLTDNLIQIKSTYTYKVKHYETKGEISKLYARTIKICSKKNNNIGLIIHYSPKIKNISFIRFELSPQHIKPKKMGYLINFLTKQSNLGDGIFELLKVAKVTRIDIALDLHGLSTSDYYFGLYGATKGKLHPRNLCNGFGGVRLGSYNSRLQIAAYDKIYKWNSDIDLNLYHHEELKFMRIEARFKFKKSDQLSLEDLIFVEKLSNPFERLAIYPLNIKQKLFKHKYFADLLDKMTIPEALSRMEKGHGKNSIREILKQGKISLFDSNALWEKEKMRCMTLLGVLQQPAYWNRINWKKYMNRLNRGC